MFQSWTISNIGDIPCVTSLKTLPSSAILTAHTAIQCALYANGMSDFSPAVHAPELGYRYIK
nr:MAG TPA: hypothetical protein [Bacteriophage sp.]